MSPVTIDDRLCVNNFSNTEFTVSKWFICFKSYIRCFVIMIAHRLNIQKLIVFNYGLKLLKTTGYFSVYKTNTDLCQNCM